MIGIATSAITAIFGCTVIVYIAIYSTAIFCYHNENSSLVR